MMIRALFFSILVFSQSALSNPLTCAAEVKKNERQLQLAFESEEMFKDLYEEARANNNLALKIFVPSSLVFTVVGTGALFAAGNGGGLSGIGYVLASPGLTLANLVIDAFKMSNATVPFVLGWASQAAPVIVSAGHGVYRLFLNEESRDLKKFELIQSLQTLDLAINDLNTERAQIYEKADHKQWWDGLMLGAVDRKMTYKLYENSLASRKLVQARLKLQKASCN